MTDCLHILWGRIIYVSTFEGDKLIPFHDLCKRREYSASASCAAAFSLLNKTREGCESCWCHCFVKQGISARRRLVEIGTRYVCIFGIIRQRLSSHCVILLVVDS
ncbi:hypothetical protein Dimus_032624 [Dionaea muscipula]